MSIAKKLHLYHHLQLAAHRAQKAADRALLSAADITTAQAAVLAVLAAQGPATQREVARQLGLTESAITAMATKLLTLRLLEREPHDSDNRAWRLSLSSAGRAAIRRIDKPFARINETFESALARSELEAFADCLTRVAEAFEADPG